MKSKSVPIISQFKYIISIVSHQQMHLVNVLLGDLEKLDLSNTLVIVRCNIPEVVEPIKTRLNVHIVYNEAQYGFGKNHNLNFKLFKCRYFIVVNPDVRVYGCNVFEELGNYSSSISDKYILSPIIISPSGSIEDFARPFPTFTKFIKRVLLRKKDFVAEFENYLPVSVEWTAGMFQFFPSCIYTLLGGYDEKYFLYCEDADICLRGKRLSIETQVYPKVSVTHDAQRASRRSLKFFLIHFTSYLKFWVRLYTKM